jgi:predicted acylesterase/phospholipase RssA
MAAGLMPRKARPHPVGLALAGGGPFGAIWETGALVALSESLEGIDFNDFDFYVGVSAGSFHAAALANGISPAEIYALFIEDEKVEGALRPEVFMRPAFGEFMRRAAKLPPLILHSLWDYATNPMSANTLESFARLGEAIPTGVFDNSSIHEYLARAFSVPGTSNDFRKLRKKLFLVATDLDTGESVSFGRPGRDHVPISKAVQASSALPGLFPPVEIEGHHYVDGALKKTLHASEALADGAKLVICVNPIVPYNAALAAAKGGRRAGKLVDGGLPVVLSQTFRAIIHSRMKVGISKYAKEYRDADVLLFEPTADDSETFFTNIFSYSTRQKVCEHAYTRTRKDLLKRRYELVPILERHGIRLRVDLLQQERHLDVRLKPRRPTPWAAARLDSAATDLRDTLVDLAHWVESQKGARLG